MMVLTWGHDRNPCVSAAFEAELDGWVPNRRSLCQYPSAFRRLSHLVHAPCGANHATISSPVSFGGFGSFLPAINASAAAKSRALCASSPCWISLAKARIAPVPKAIAAVPLGSGSSFEHALASGPIQPLSRERGA
jgi:hypothetical protein